MLGVDFCISWICSSEVSELPCLDNVPAHNQYIFVPNIAHNTLTLDLDKEHQNQQVLTESASLPANTPTCTVFLTRVNIQYHT